jgi:hypothetical protein
VTLTSNLPFSYDSDNSLTAPLNWLYDPDGRGPNMKYLVYDFQSRLGNGLNGFNPEQAIQQPYRAATFTGGLSQAVVVYIPAQGCARLLDPAIDVHWPGLPANLVKALPLSRLELALAGPIPVMPPPIQTGSTSVDDWCRFYETADQARAASDWKTAALIADQATPLFARLPAIQAAEMGVFIEIYARTGKLEQAAQLTDQAIQRDPDVELYLTDLWNHIGRTVDIGRSCQKAALIESRWSCSTY